MATHRLKHSFSAGELSPLMESRYDFNRYNNGCIKLQNMLVTTQGPVTRRPGTEFIYDLTGWGQSTTKKSVRMVPFIFNEIQSYQLVFFYTISENAIALIIHDQKMLLDLAGTAPLIIHMISDFKIETFDWAQSNDVLFITQGTARPIEIRRLGHQDWDVRYQPFTDPTPATPTWSDTLGWPETVTFHQQRLVYGGNKTRRQTVWMSEADNFNNFETITGGTVEKPVAFTFDSGTQNQIQWLVSLKALNAGTVGDEWTITGSTRDAIVPGGVITHRQTNRGSVRLEPLIIGITILFLERFGRTINEFVYDFNTDSYQTSDVSILSKHITEIYSITGWAYQQTPDSIIWAVREDGALLGITYQRQHEVIGWHVHTSAGDFFRTVGSIPGTVREDEVYVVVERYSKQYDFEGNPQFQRHYIERLPGTFVQDNASDGRFLDSHVQRTTVEEQIGGVTYGAGSGVVSQLMPPLAAVTTYTITVNIVECNDRVALKIFQIAPGSLEFEHVFSAPGRYEVFFNCTVSASYEIKLYNYYVDPPDDNYPPAPAYVTELSLKDPLYGEHLQNPTFIDLTGWSVTGDATLEAAALHHVLTDLTHLEDRVVSLIRDGVYEGERTVVNERVVLGAGKGGTYLVGLPYVSEVWPTAKEVTTQEGSIAGRTQRITNLDIDLYDSGSFTCGRWSRTDGEQEEFVDLAEASHDPSVQVPLYTGIRHYEFPEGFDRDTQYFIRQDKPLPLTIRAVTDSVEVTK